MRKGAEVVVVGGGIIGCAITSELAGMGIDVLLLEQHEIAHGASGRNHGLIFYPQSPVTDPLFRQSLQMYRDLQHTSSVNLGLDDEPRGLLILVRHEDEWQAAEDEARASEAGGVKVERLTGSDLLAAEPALNEAYLGAWRMEDGYRVDPAALTLALALGAVDRNAQVTTHISVKQVLVNNSSVFGVATDEGVVECKTVINAAGPWASKLGMSADLDIPISGARGWLLLTRAQPPRCRHLLVSAGWHARSWDTGGRVTLDDYSSPTRAAQTDTGTLIQQNRSGHVLVGGSRVTSHREDPEGHEVTKELARRAVDMVPALASAPLEAVWSGVRPVSPDGLPLIGWHPEVEGFFTAGGHGGQGIILGGGSGRLAAEMVAGTEPFTGAAPFALERFASS